VRAPEHIALAAAHKHAPAAEAWAAEKRGRYAHDGGELAEMAKRRHATLARFEGAATGVGGIFTVVPDLLGLAWIQTRLVFFVAAAYGYDPRDPMRPAELLALQEVYPTPAEAREALDGVGGRLAGALAKRALVGGRDQGLARQLAVFAGKRIARRYAGRLVPLIGSPIGAVQNAGATKDLGRRALAYYGGTQARP
jgi:uncharacterized protein (DUF697 family)